MKEHESVLPESPLSDDDVLDNFFKPSRRVQAPKLKKPEPKPAHYKICCISLYKEDIENLESMVQTLKQRGYSKANKSQLIRYALSTVDLDSMPKQL